jgi:hypothetical protein
MDLRSILPYLKISGQYSIDGIMLGVFPIFGDGPFTVELFDLVMLGGGDLDIDPTGKYLQVFLSAFFPPAQLSFRPVIDV